MVKSARSSDPAPASSQDVADDGPAADHEQRPSSTGVRPVRRPKPKRERASAAIAPPRPGEMSPARMVGRCEIFTEIAEGDLASVYIGRQIGVGGFARTVAVKVMHQEHARDPAFRHKFLAEAQVVARIRHPAVVSTLDLVEEDDELIIVMEYVEGDTLSHLMRPPGKPTAGPPVGVALNILSATLHGLHAAHEACDAQGEPMNLVHRDVNPHNVLVGVDGYARLMDFGLARALGQCEATQTGGIHGEPGYRAPEQIRSEAIDGRTDVFSASVMLWHALTGEALFGGNNPLAVATKVLKKKIEPPSTLASKIPAPLDAIVLKGLERDPDERWPTALAMAEAIDALGLSADQHAVGAWVRKRAHEELRRRASLVARVERAPVDEEAMERKATLPVYRRPAKDAAGAILPVPPEQAEDPPSAPGEDEGDQAPLDEASFDHEADEQEQGKGRAAPPTPAAPQSPRVATQEAAGKPRKLLILAGAAVFGGILALVTLTGDETDPERPVPSARPAPTDTAAPPPSPAAPSATQPGTAEPAASATAPTSAATAMPPASASGVVSADPGASAPAASATSVPSSQPPSVGSTTKTPTPQPTSTGLYGRE